MAINKINNYRFTIFRIVRIAIFSAIIFMQEELLTFLPNFQFTQVLIAIYYYSFGLLDTIIIVVIHTLLDNLFMSSFNILYTPAMLIGWLSLVFILYIYDRLTKNKHVNKNKYIIATIVGLHGFLYCWGFLITSLIVTKVEFIPYLISDILFEVILVITGFVTTIILLEPLSSVLIKLENHYKNKDDSE